MNGKKTKGALCLLVAILFLSYNPVSADPIVGDPTFQLPNSATNNPLPYGNAKPVANGYSFSSMYLDSGGNAVWNITGEVYTNAAGSLSWGPANSNSNLYADPGSFEAKAAFKAWTDGSQNYQGSGTSRAFNWFVLAGNPGDEVTLAADILIQGKAYANNGANGNAGTIFGIRLGFLSNPADLSQDWVTSLTGAVNYTGGFAEDNTVTVDGEDFLWDKGSVIQEVNYIIRSQPFTVTVGVPFRLFLQSNTQGWAGPGDLGEAWSDFYDPRLVTSADFPTISQLTSDGFAVVLGEGLYSTLGDAGYSIASVPVPEPATMLLLGSGLIGLAGYGRKKFFKK